MKTSILFAVVFLFSGLTVPDSFGQTRSSEGGNGTTLRILTYNIHHANPPSKKDKIDIDAIVKVIKEADADIIGLQEVDKNTVRSGGIDQAKLIGEKAGLYYHFFKAIDHDGGEYGLAILSKKRLKQVKLVRLPQVIEAEKRILACVDVKVGGKKITFANTHLDASRAPDNRIVQMKHILEIFRDKKTPVILCGDLNSVAGSEPINLLDQIFRRTCTENCPGTIPQVYPRSTIDFVAVKNAGWPVLSHQVIAETYASDHRPVLVTFKVK